MPTDPKFPLSQEFVTRVTQHGEPDISVIGADFAATAGVDIAQFWKVTPEWLQAQPTNYIVAAVAEARGKKQAEDVMRQKGKSAAVAKAMEYLGVIAGWLPEPLRPPAPAKDGGKKSTKARGKK
jgi:hypothetical protein